MTDDAANRPADPFVRARGDSPASGAVSLSGLLGDSDRPGCRRLYLTTALDYYAEFQVGDVIDVADVPADQPPFPGLDATRVTLPGDANVQWVRRVAASDPFDLRVSRRTVQPPELTTWGADCPAVTHHFGESDFDPCRGGVPGTGGGTFGPFPSQGGHTCATCNQETCATCDQNTCVTCGRGTCNTCGRATCATCNQHTCVTCGRVTCDRGGCVPTAATCASCAGTCDVSCATCWATCEATCVSCRGTCDATCANTCADTCANTCGPTCAATCETCNTCGFFTCGTCQTDPGWCLIRG